MNLSPPTGEKPYQAALQVERAFPEKGGSFQLAVENVEEIRFVPGAACDQTTIVGHRNLFLEFFLSRENLPRDIVVW
jgi:hypothetical protein